QETEVPESETVVFSAHGVAPSVHANAERRTLRTIDATCPLVTKVHVEAKKFAAQGYTIVLIGHAGHEEVEGTMGEAPESIVLIEVARAHGAEAHLIDNELLVEEEWLEGKRTVGITSGASAPEELVQRLVDFFRERGTREVSEFEVVQEDVRFMLPKEIRKAMAATA